MTAEQKEAPDLEQVILRLLRQRAAGASICPSDAARAARPAGWRTLMDDVVDPAGLAAAAAVLAGGDRPAALRAKVPLNRQIERAVQGLCLRRGYFGLRDGGRSFGLAPAAVARRSAEQTGRAASSREDRAA